MTDKAIKPWKEYEQVAAQLLNEFATHFGFDRVEEGQKLLGVRSSAQWKVDAKGVRDSDGAIFVIECRRYPKRRINQEAIAGLSYRIQDIGANGGIIVSPLQIQEGARRVAKAEKIISVQLDPNSTPSDFAMRFFGRLMVGVSIKAKASFGVSFDAEVMRRCKICGKRFSVAENERHCPECPEGFPNK